MSEEILKKTIELELEKALEEQSNLEKRPWFTCDVPSTKKRWYKITERIRILKKLLRTQTLESKKGEGQ